MIDSQNVHENYVIINGDADISVGDDIRFLITTICDFL